MSDDGLTEVTVRHDASFNDCRFRWTDADTASYLGAEFDDTHRCVLSGIHEGEHVCDCGARHDTGHEGE